MPRFLRYLVGAPTPRREDRTSWKDYVADLAGWALVAAFTAVLVFLGYRGLELVGLVK